MPPLKWYCLPFIFVVSLFFHNTFASDTLRIVSHRNEFVVTDPSTGVNTYTHRIQFPSPKASFRKVLLHVQFACPDSGRCADWDYMDRIIVRKPETKGMADQHEVGRMLTPYGGAFGRQWNFSWDVDISHFSTILRDSLDVIYEHPGYEPNKDRGWKITVTFQFIKGKPDKEIASITKLYDGSFPYGDATQDIETFLKPITLKVGKETTSAAIVIAQTGHGMDSVGCAEFCDRVREVSWDNTVIDKRNIWKKCGDNPLYPQAGTWLIDRAYWCPGNLIQPDIIHVPVQPGSTHTVDISMQQYVQEKPSAVEVISAYLVEYKKSNAKLDASLEEIAAPTDEKIHLRYNPACANASIQVRNLGTETIRTLNIRYGTTGFPGKNYSWKGNLSPNAATSITLPGTIDARQGVNEFTATIVSVNGGKDAYKNDNTLKSRFTRAAQHQGPIIFVFQTNKQPADNAYKIANADGKIFMERKLGSLEMDKNYRDTLSLPPGCYTLTVQDTASNGLEFWFNGKGGRGFCRVLDEKGQLVKNFESDFGSSLQYNFSITTNKADVTPPQQEPAIGLSPTRTKGKTTLDFFSNDAKETIVEIVSDPANEVVERHVYQSLKEGIFQYDLSYRPAQRYYLKVYRDGKLIFNKRIRVGE